jgi:hypothetical protein
MLSPSRTVGGFRSRKSQQLSAGARRKRVALFSCAVSSLYCNFNLPASRQRLWYPASSPAEKEEDNADHQEYKE